MASLKDLIVMGPARFLDKLYGNLEGNATSANKLKTARSINGTNFDGTTAITTANWGTARTITISDNSGTNTQANTGINGSANFTLKLPATIKANLSGKATSAETADSAITATTAGTCTGNAATATKLQTAKTINGTFFDGTSNITTSYWGTTRALKLAQDSSGSVSVNGSSDIILNITNNKMKGYEFISGIVPYVWYTSQKSYENSTVPTADWYVKIVIDANWISEYTPLYIVADYSNVNGKLIFNLDSYDSYWTAYLTNYVGSNILAIRRARNNTTSKNEIFLKLKMPTAHNGVTYKGNITVYSPYTIDSITACTAVDAGTLINLNHGYNSNTPITTTAQIYGNAATATVLQTTRTINGTSFNGSSNITTSYWGTTRTLTVGNTGKSVNGSDNVSWGLAEIGATVSNAWTNGAAAGPKLTTTVNGVAAAAVTIPSASTSVSGVVTNVAQTFAGNKLTTGQHIGLVSGGETDQFLDFAYASDPTAAKAPGASWRIGALNSGAGDTNYLVIQTGGSDTNATTWNNVIRLGMNTHDASFGGNIYPLTNSSKSLGTSGLQWKDIYGNWLHLSGTANATMTYASTNPSITFSENGSQPVKLMYTDYDDYRSPAGLKVIGGTSATPAWFEVEGALYTGGLISATGTITSVSTITGNRFVISNSSSAAAHIEFSRVGWNYIIGPSGSSIAISPTGSTGDSNARLVIDSSAVYPGVNNGTINLGTSSCKWNNVYGNNFSGNANTATAFSSNRAIALTGAVTGSASTNGASGWSITATIAEKQITPTDITTAFRTQTKGNANNGAYLSVIRSESIDSWGYMPQYGSGIAFGRQDTQTYLYTNYSSAYAYIGGGNGNKLNWIKRIAFTDGTGASGIWEISIRGTAAKSTADGDGNTISSTYLKKSGGAMNGTAIISWPDSGNWSNNNSGVTFPVARGGFQWNGQSDYIKLFAEETATDQLNLVCQFGDDSSPALVFRNTSGSQIARIGVDGIITATTFSGSFSGNATSATQLATARNIFGRSFNGTVDIAGKATVYGSYNATVDSRYSTAALEIRENGLVGTAQSDISYAPQIGFHWSGRVAGQLALGSDAKFRFIKQDGNTATLIANLEGNASSASKLGSSTLGSSQTPIYLNAGTATQCETFSNRIHAYKNGAVYYYMFGGSQDLNWKKVFSASHTATAPTTATYVGCTVKGTIYHIKGNYDQAEVDEYDFLMHMTFLSNLSVSNSCTLRTAAGCPDTIIRAVRVTTNSFELQVRQPADWQQIAVQFSIAGNCTSRNVFNPTNSSNASAIGMSRLTTSRYISDIQSGVGLNFAYGTEPTNKTAGTIWLVPV